MIFEQLNEGSCLTYLVGSQTSSKVALIDPLIEHVDHYMARLKKDGLTLTHVIDTHTHADHISACPKLVDLTGCQYVMHETAQPKCVTQRLKDGEEVKIDDVAIKFIHTPGHTRDSVSLQIGDKLITGDVLFLDDGGAGRDDLPGGNAAEHWESLQKLLKLPDHLVVYPAHEYRNRKHTTLGEQKQRNPFFKPGSKDEYIKYLDSLHLGPADWMKDVLIANANCTRDPKAAFIPAGVSACEVKGTGGHAACTSEFIQPTEVQQKLEAGTELFLLDVRELAELQGELGHVKGVTHIPVGQLEDRLGEIESEKDKTVISICKSGVRAARAATMLKLAGFEQVLVMEGGMVRWNECGLPVKRPEHVG
jgi:sulfur dioxygenase